MTSDRYARASLIGAWAECQAANPVTSLRVKLAANAAAAQSATAGGIIKSTSANGHMVSFADGTSRGGFSPGELVDMWVMLLELFDGVKSDLAAGASDTDVEVVMEVKLRPVANYTNDWRFARR